MKSCERCLTKVRPDQALSIIEPDNTMPLWFCSWRCLAGYAAGCARHDEDLAQQVAQHIAANLDAMRAHDPEIEGTKQ